MSQSNQLNQLYHVYVETGVSADIQYQCLHRVVKNLAKQELAKEREDVDAGASRKEIRLENLTRGLKIRACASEIVGRAASLE